MLSMLASKVFTEKKLHVPPVELDYDTHWFKSLMLGLLI